MRRRRHGLLPLNTVVRMVACVYAVRDIADVNQRQLSSHHVVEEKQMRYVAKALLVAAIVLLPVLTHAQSLAGTVRDASGAVLPGVTVEAASSVLIEKVRTAVTDGAGQYRIENLPPGTYTLTYSLPGFVTVKRDGVELSGSGVLTINSDLRVGGIQET